MGASRKYELHEGITLKLDEERGPIRYKKGTTTATPLVDLFFIKGKKITQEQATKAASKVMGLKVVVTSTRIQLSTAAAVTGWNDAEAIVASFVNELNKLLRSRDRNVALSRARKAGSRDKDYVYTPPGRI